MLDSYDFGGKTMESKKKKKKSKKEKKSKRHKSSKKKKMASSSESVSGSDEMEWVEVSAQSKKPEVQVTADNKKLEVAADSKKPEAEVTVGSKKPEREDWMSQEEFVPTISKEEILGRDPNYRRRTGRKDQRQDLYEPGKHERELNPYWKNDGKGVPDENEDQSLGVKLPSTSVFDGGLSWLKKAYKRIQEQAAEEGRAMEDIAVERWGSLDKLKSLIAEAEERASTRHTSRYKDDYHGRHNSERDYSCNQEVSRSSYQKYGKNTESKYQQKASTSTSYDKSMFKRPSHEYTREKKEAIGTAYASSHEPAWKKKKRLQDSPVSEEQVKAGPNIKDTVYLHPKESTHPEETIKDPPLEENLYLTDSEMNNLAAKVLKAELLGNTELAAQLQLKLDAARNARKTLPAVASCHAKKTSEEVILSKIDSHGTLRPLIAPDTSYSTSKNRRNKKNDSSAKMSKIRSYFSDKSEHSLREMFQREKLTTADDQIEMFVDAAVESQGLTDQDYETGDISAKTAHKMGHQRQDERDYHKAIQEHKRLNTALERCQYCFEKTKKHLVVSESPQAYLCLPSYQSLTESHCLIVPKGHVSSSLLLDEDVAEEIQNLKKTIINMFKQLDQCVIFVETSINLRYSPHLVIECFPVPVDIENSAPMYFKKAIQEHGSEWANNIKLVDLFKKDLKHSVPKGLPFFAVEFSRGGGYAHVIEDKDFPRHFGKEIIGGMLEIDSHLCTRYKKEDFKEQAQKALQFTKLWKSYMNKINAVT